LLAKLTLARLSFRRTHLVHQWFSSVSTV